MKVGPQLSKLTLEVASQLQKLTLQVDPQLSKLTFEVGWQLLELTFFQLLKDVPRNYSTFVNFGSTLEAGQVVFQPRGTPSPDKLRGPGAADTQMLLFSGFP